MALKIFLNYRREDTKGQALALRQFLSRKLPRAELFMDIDGGIRPSENFLRVLSERVAGSDVFLCLIGDRWLETADAKGNRRLDNADDFVRTEIAAALRRDIPVIPVLVDGTNMPSEWQLPDEIKLLSLRQGVQLRHESFEADAEGIRDAIRQVQAGRKPRRRVSYWLAAAFVLLALAMGALVGRWTGADFSPKSEIEALRKQVAALEAGQWLETKRYLDNAIKSEPNSQNYASEKTSFGVPSQVELKQNLSSETPLELPVGRRIGTIALRGALEKYMKGEIKIALIDVWSSEHSETIPYAHRIPVAGLGGDFSDTNHATLAADLSKLSYGSAEIPLIFFCPHAKCWESYNACLRAAKLGYKNIYWYRGGLAAWQEAGLPLQESERAPPRALPLPSPATAAMPSGESNLTKADSLASGTKTFAMPAPEVVKNRSEMATEPPLPIPAPTTSPSRAAVGTATAIPSPVGILPASNAEVHGVVEIGGSGVKASIFQVTRAQARDIEANFQRNEGTDLKYRTLDEHLKHEYKTIEANAVNSENIPQVVAAVKEFLTSMEQEYAVPRNQMFVVASSGIAGVPHFDQLQTQLEGNLKIRLDQVDAAQECEMTFQWITPRYRYEQVVVIDVGSSNVKACYLEDITGSRTKFRAFELLPFGTKRFSRKIVTELTARNLQPKDFIDVAHELRRKEIEPILDTFRRNNPGLQTLPRLYLAGGIAWATSSLIRPQTVGEKWAVASVNDYLTLQNRAVAGRAFDLDLVVLKRDEVKRQEAENTASRIRRNIFSQEDLIAGTEIVLGMAARLHFEQKSAIFFAAVARDSWRSQYLLERILDGKGNAMLPQGKQ